MATRLRNGGIARDSKEAYTLLLSCVGIRPQLPATSTYEDAMVRIADLIDPPTRADARHGSDVDRCDDAPDSWERLEGDVRRSLGPMAACSYFGRGMGDGCRGCPSGARGSDCNRAMAGDILRRSEALAGVARQTCRLVPPGDGTGRGACCECHGALTDKDNFCPDCGREIGVTDD